MQSWPSTRQRRLKHYGKGLIISLTIEYFLNGRYTHAFLLLSHWHRYFLDFVRRVEYLEKQSVVNVERFKQKTKELKSTVHQELEDATLDAASRKLNYLITHIYCRFKLFSYAFVGLFFLVTPL